MYILYTIANTQYNLRSIKIIILKKMSYYNSTLISAQVLSFKHLRNYMYRQLLVYDSLLTLEHSFRNPCWSHCICNFLNCSLFKYSGLPRFKFSSISPYSSKYGDGHTIPLFSLDTIMTLQLHIRIKIPKP